MGTLQPIAWRNIGTSATVLNWILEGVPLHIASIPQVCALPNCVSGAKAHNFVDQQVAELLLQDRIRRIPNKEAHCVLPLLVVAKKGGKLHLVLDCRHLNNNISCPSFKQEGLESVSTQILPGDKLFSSDISSGFHHLRMRPNERKFLCFTWRNHTFCWTVLPFGVKSAPYLFSKVIKEVIKYFRASDVRCTAWVDNFIFMVKTDKVESQLQFIQSTFHDLGLVLNRDKCDFDCTGLTTFVGFLVHSEGSKGPWLQVPKKKIVILQWLLRTVLRQSSVPVHTWARVAGKCVSLSCAVIPGKLLLRNVYRTIGLRHSWEDRMFLDKPTCSDLDWWLQALPNWNGKPLLQAQVHQQIFTDASGTGWGGWTGHLQAGGMWSTAGVFQHSNVKELLAVWKTLQSLPDVRHKVIQVVSDNISTVACINRLSSASSSLTTVMKQVLVWCDRRDITLVARHLSGVQNAQADYLSRVLFRHEWQLNPKLFTQLDRMWGPHHVDRFASATTALLPVYNSLFLDPQTSGVDAMVQDWSGTHNWWNPPFALLPQVIKKIQRERATGTLIAPLWCGATWYRELQNLSVSPPLHLPSHPGLCTRRAGHSEVLKNFRWKICAWNVSGKIGCSTGDGQSQQHRQL